MIKYPRSPSWLPSPGHFSACFSLRNGPRYDFSSLFHIFPAFAIWCIQQDLNMDQSPDLKAGDSGQSWQQTRSQEGQPPRSKRYELFLTWSKAAAKRPIRTISLRDTGSSGNWGMATPSFSLGHYEKLT